MSRTPRPRLNKKVVDSGVWTGFVVSWAQGGAEGIGENDCCIDPDACRASQQLLEADPLGGRQWNRGKVLKPAAACG